ncbi:MAG: NAD(P)-dependent glycerol-3-phosphate dehydrogenase [Stomatobaculum sp.]|nr:NAD(P)-dependent glycerol-3-phosphate dehydrogenase [Stomatobaculum sp.]
MSRAAVIGSGTWGSALAMLLAGNGHEVTVWSAFQEEIDGFLATRKHVNLPGAEFPDSIAFTTDLEEAMEGKEILVLAVPSIFTRGTAAKMRPFYRPGQIIVSVAKGIEEKTLKIQTEQIEEEIPGSIVTCLSGPSHAEEVSRGIPTICVAGSRARVYAEKVQKVFSSPVFRVYVSPDLLGIELGASIKNVIALAAGIADGLGCGDNTKAALITRGIAEITRLGEEMGASAETFAGLSGIGDLIVTCASMHSRNRRAGILIGKGYTAEQAMKEVKQVVEGVYSAKAALALSRAYDVNMPLVEEVNRILFEGKSPAEALNDLMTRDSKAENQQLNWPGERREPLFGSEMS